jgi:hypothetical protein
VASVPLAAHAGRATTRDECALKESAPLVVEVLKQFLSMQLKLGARLIIACAHDGVSSPDELDGLTSRVVCLAS